VTTNTVGLKWQGREGGNYGKLTASKKTQKKRGLNQRGARKARAGRNKKSKTREWKRFCKKRVWGKRGSPQKLRGHSG